MLEVTSSLLCHTGTPSVPDPMPERVLGAAGGEPDSKESLLPAGPQVSVEKSLTPPGTASAAPSLPAAPPHPTSLQGWGAAGVTSHLLQGPHAPLHQVLADPSAGVAVPRPEASQPGPWSCVGTAGERWEQQSWLQTETLQLQEEKFLLEITRLRRELGT